MKCVLRSASICGWINQKSDDVEKFDDGSWPAMSDDQRQGIQVRRPQMEEMHSKIMRHDDSLNFYACILQVVCIRVSQMDRRKAKK